MSTEPFVRSFGLSDLPFSKEIASGELWLPPSKQALVDDLCDAIDQRTQVLLVGEPGVLSLTAAMAIMPLHEAAPFAHGRDGHRPA